jgi:hypothetical protein
VSSVVPQGGVGVPRHLHPEEPPSGHVACHFSRGRLGEVEGVAVSERAVGLIQAVSVDFAVDLAPCLLRRGPSPRDAAALSGCQAYPVTLR